MENTSDFYKGCDFFEKNYSQNELYKFLSNGSDMEKQLAALKIETVTYDNEAEILMLNLTGVDGKIREAVSYKLKIFMQNSETAKLFNQPKFYDIFLDAVIDINGNICRNIISALTNIKEDKNFAQYFKSKIFERTKDVLKKIDNFTYKDKKYKTNKELFKLYWYLETLALFDFDDTVELFNLLVSCAKVEEYTIQEKTAALLSKLPLSMREKISINTQNPYVARKL